MDEERTLLSIANTYASTMTQKELDGWKSLLKDSTDRRAYRIFNNGQQYDTAKEYFITGGSNMNILNVYVGKEVLKVDIDNLLSTDIEVLDKITYEAARKHQDLIPAIEITVEDCLGTVIDIKDEASFKLAIADLVNIINMDEATEVTIAEVEQVVAPETNGVDDKQEEKEEIVIMNNTTTSTINLNKEEETMYENIWEEATKEFTAEQQIGGFGRMADKLKDELAKWLDGLDTIFGCRMAKHEILSVLEAGAKEGESAKDLIKMAQKCQEIIDKKVAAWQASGDEELFKKAVALKKYTIGEDGKSIFDSFAIGMIWISKHVGRKVHNWTGASASKIKNDTLKSLIKSIGNFAGVLRKGVRYLGGGVKIGLSYVIAVGAKLGDLFHRAIMFVVEKIEGWFDIAKQKFAKDDDEFINADYTIEVI